MITKTAQLKKNIMDGNMKEKSISDWVNEICESFGNNEARIIAEAKRVGVYQGEGSSWYENALALALARSRVK